MTGGAKIDGKPGTGQVAAQDEGGRPARAKQPTAEIKIPVEGQPAHVHVTAPQDLPQELIDTDEAPVRSPAERAARAGTVQSVAPAPPTNAARASNTLNALIHLYRGELGRMTAYRARLDTSTNWAITTSALVTSFSLGSAERSHAAFLFLMFLDYFFLHLEAKRFQAFEASRYLLQLMERAFYPEVLGEDVDPRWTDRLIKVLRGPGLKVSYRGALGWRLRRNYLWIYFAILLAWLSKLDAAGLANLSFVSRAGVGSVPGWLVCLGVAALYTWLVYVAASARRCYSLGGAAECD
jgi:uncharacterized membrane protein